MRLNRQARLEAVDAVITAARRWREMYCREELTIRSTGDEVEEPDELIVERGLVECELIDAIDHLDSPMAGVSTTPDTNQGDSREH